MKQKTIVSENTEIADVSADQFSDILTKVFLQLSDGMVYVHNRIHENTNRNRDR